MTILTFNLNLYLCHMACICLMCGACSKGVPQKDYLGTKSIKLARLASVYEDYEMPISVAEGEEYIWGDSQLTIQPIKIDTGSQKAQLSIRNKKSGKIYQVTVGVGEYAQDCEFGTHGLELVKVEKGKAEFSIHWGRVYTRSPEAETKPIARP